MQKEPWKTPLTIFMLIHHQQPSPNGDLWENKTMKNYENILYCTQSKLATPFPQTYLLSSPK